MPKKVKTRRSPSSARSRTARGKKRSPASRPRSGERTPDAAVARPTLYTVRFKEKPGTEVFFKALGHPLDDPKGLYQILLSAAKRLETIRTGKPVDFDPLEKGITMPFAAAYVLRRLSDQIPRGFEFNIDREGKDYVVTIFQECPYDWSWSAFEVGPALRKLEKENKRLFGLFLSFLNQYSSACQIPIWDDGIMAYGLDYLKDSVLVNDFENAEDKRQVKKAIAEYEKGDPKRYIALIRKAPKIPLPQMQSRARCYKAGQPIANLIHQGVEIMRQGRSLTDYIYRGYYGDDFASYLHLLDQSAILFDASDLITQETETFLDANAQEGVEHPFVTLQIKKKTTKADLDKLESLLGWPMQLQQFTSRAQELVTKYLRKR
ncbi:MAG TPA: hypothetical protein VFE32_17255 [Puia sp.]|nr:hypothetical protein [Puia sp.]